MRCQTLPSKVSPRVLRSSWLRPCGPAGPEGPVLLCPAQLLCRSGRCHRPEPAQPLSLPPEEELGGSSQVPPELGHHRAHGGQLNPAIASAFMLVVQIQPEQIMVQSSTILHALEISCSRKEQLHAETSSPTRKTRCFLTEAAARLTQ